jgi:betaine-homocysteine S-methyltransferase
MTAAEAGRMVRGLLERLDDGVVLGDGGYLLELERRGWVQAGPFTPEVTITHPEALLELHREFARAGAEVLQALTFYASEEKLRTVGLAGKVDDINRSAVSLANQAADEAAVGRERPLVAGNLSLTWVYDAAVASSHDKVRALFDRQLEDQMAVGIDFVIGETFSYLGEALLALERAKATGLPTVVTMSFDREPRSYDGHSVGDCARALVGAGADVVGVNCLRDPWLTLPLMTMMRVAEPHARLASQPVAYRTNEDAPDFTSRPEFPFALDTITIPRGEMAEYALRARELGIRYIGACCGTVASHIRAMGKALGKLPAEEREWRSPTDKPMSAYEYHGHTETEAPVA